MRFFQRRGGLVKMGFVKALFGRKKSKACVRSEPAFMACFLRLNYESTMWEKAVTLLLNKMVVVRTCTIGEDGLLEVSGTVHPKVLMKTLAKTKGRADLAWIQFGECSGNLFGPDRRRFVTTGAVDAIPPQPHQLNTIAFPTSARRPPLPPPQYLPPLPLDYHGYPRQPGGYYGARVPPYYHGDGQSSCAQM